MKIVLEADGVGKSEQETYDDFSEVLYETENKIISTLDAGTSSVSTGSEIEENGITRSDNTLAPDEALKEGLAELNELVGVGSVKAEISRLTNFLKIQQQRIDQGMTVPKQSLHFVLRETLAQGRLRLLESSAKSCTGFKFWIRPTLLKLTGPQWSAGMSDKLQSRHRKS